MGAASLVGTLQGDVRCACHIGKTLYTADTQGNVLEWNLQDTTSRIFMSGLAAPVNVVVGVKRGMEMWAGLVNGTIASLLVESRTFGNQIVHAHDAAVNCIAEGSSCVWSVGVTLYRDSCESGGYKRGVCSLHVMEFNTGGDDFLIKQWDLQGVPIFSYNHHHGSIRDLLIIRNKPEKPDIELWCSSNDSTISVASLQDRKTQHESASEVKMLTGHTKAVLALCKVGVDAIWSGCEDGSIRVWSTLGLRFKKQLNGHKGPVVSLVVMGGNVWSGSGDHTILVWEASLCQLLYSLGDHGGYVKAMVRVEYMCWIFASGKNVKIWCAQSVWDTYEQEKERLSREVLKIKDSLDKSQIEKKLLEDASEKSQESNAEKLSALEKEMKIAQNQLKKAQKGAATLEERTAATERSKHEQAEKLKELQRLVAMADETKKSLADENKLLIGKISKLKGEKEGGEAAAKTKLQALEKDLMKAQADLKKSQDEEKDMLKKKRSIESQRINDFEKLKGAEDEKGKLVNEVAQLKESMRREKDMADQAVKSLQEVHGKELGELAKRLEEMQHEVEHVHGKSSSQLQGKDVEIEKLKGDIRKKSKDLKKTLKNFEDEKTRSAKEMQELRQAVEHMKKSQDATLTSEAQHLIRIANLEKELQQARNDLQEALDEKSQTLAGNDSNMQKLKKKVGDFRKALKDAENDRSKLQQLLKEKEKNQAAIDDEHDKLRKQNDDLSLANRGLQSDLDRVEKLLEAALSEANESGKGLQDLKTQLKNLDDQLAQMRALAAKSASDLQNLDAEKDNLLKSLNSTVADKVQLAEELGLMRAESSRNASNQASALEDFKRQHDDDMKKLEGLEKEIDLNLGDISKSTDALDQLTKGKSVLEHKLQQATNELEQLRNEKLLQDEKEAHKAGEVVQLEQRLAQALDDLELFKKQKVSQEEAAANMDEEIKQLRQEKAKQEERLTTVSDQVHQLKKQNEGTILIADEVTHLKKEITKREEHLACAAEELEQLRKEKSAQDKDRACMADEVYWLKNDKTHLEGRLECAVEELEQLKKNMSVLDKELTYTADELHQLKSEKTRLEGNLTFAADENYLLRMERTLSDRNIAQKADEVEQLKKERDVLKEHVSTAADELEQLGREKASLQADLEQGSDELEQLKKVKTLLEGILARETNGLEQLRKEKSLLEINLAQVADGLEQQKRENEFKEAGAAHMADVNDHLATEMAILEDGVAAFQNDYVDMQKEIDRLLMILTATQDECRLAKQIGCSDAANAAWRIEELQRSVAELENALNEARSNNTVEDPIWERVRELEMALMQAHMNQTFLSQEIKRMCKRRKSNPLNVRAIGIDVAKKQQNFHRAHKSLQRALHKFDKVSTEGMGVPSLGENMELTTKVVHPGFSVEYTNLKVSGCGNQQTTVRDVEVCPKTSIPHTPQRPTQRTIPIHVPSPLPERIETVESPQPVITEKERYFPSHGALRVRRGLGPSSPRGEYNV